MFDSILATKDSISQTFVGGGRRIPTTKIQAGPCVVTYVRNMEKDGYWAMQLGIGERKSKNIGKPLQGHLKKVIKGKTSPRFITEIRLKEEPKVNVGEIIKASDIFSAGDLISVSGISKGKGFAGGVKRWHFAGGNRTHGQSDRERAPGSIGQGTTPGRIYKGKHMAGRMGFARVTVKNLQVISVDPETNEVEVSGPVPGITGALLVVKRLSEGVVKGITEVVAAPIAVEAEAPSGESDVKVESQKEEVKPNA
jgi:large subunit ribosomal protein L3